MTCLLSFVALLLLIGCGGPGELAAQEPPEAPAADEAPAAQAPAGPVTRIVFIGQEQACDCTTKRIADVNTALTAALKGREIAIERLYTDHDSDLEAVEMHREMRSFMVAPALFFFDARDRLVDMTQGEVGEEKLRAILAREGSPPS